MRGRGLGFAFAWLLVAWPGYTYSDGEASREYAEAIRRAVLENPEVNREWHRFSASQQAQKAAKGALLPEVNLNATAGREERPFSRLLCLLTRAKTMPFSINLGVFQDCSSYRLCVLAASLPVAICVARPGHQ